MKILTSVVSNLLSLSLMALLTIQNAFSAEDPLLLLKTLVETNSGTNNVAGVESVQSTISAELVKLGFTLVRKPNPNPNSSSNPDSKPNPNGKQTSADLLIGILAGANQSKYITFITHADTVFEPDSHFNHFEISPNMKTAYGPGVIDDKGGVVVALNGIRQYLKQVGKPKYSLRFVSAPNEEHGSAVFLDEFKRFSHDSVLILGFEPAMDDGSIVESRRGNRWYQITVHGKEAHAGRSHADGINACHELAIKLDRLARLTDYDRDVTISIGQMSGGKDKFNIVCGEAEAKIDVRFADSANREQVLHKIKKILESKIVHSQSTGEYAKTDVSIESDVSPYSVNEQSKKYLKAYLGVVSKIENRIIKAVRSGGSADTNMCASPEVAILDGLGPVGSGMHTDSETIVLDSIRTRAEALSQFLITLN